jgi:hypothetical protein
MLQRTESTRIVSPEKDRYGRCVQNRADGRSNVLAIAPWGRRVGHDITRIADGEVLSQQRSVLVKVPSREVACCRLYAPPHGIRRIPRVTCLAGSTWRSVRGTHDDDVHAFTQMRNVACGDAKERVGGYRRFSSHGRRTPACWSRSLHGPRGGPTGFDLRSILTPPGAKTPHLSRLVARAAPIARGRAF